MKAPRSLLALLLASAAMAQTTPPARTAATPARAGQAREAARSGEKLPPDPDLFDGSKFDAEKRPETGMLGEFEMPGGPEKSDKVGGDPGQAGGGNQPPPPNAAAGGAAGAASAASGGAPAAGSESAAGGGASAEKAGAAGAVGGALDQSKPMGTGQSSGAGDPNARAEGMQADSIQGASGGAAAAAQNSANQTGKSKAASGKIGSAELRIDALPPEAEKDVIGREAAPGGTQGSNKTMPSGKGGQGSQNQNKGVEKGKVMPKGL